MNMKCDICGKDVVYSEETIHHWTLIIDGKLKAHSHLCIPCEKSLGLEIKSIKRGKNV